MLAGSFCLLLPNAVGGASFFLVPSITSKSSRESESESGAHHAPLPAVLGSVLGSSSYTSSALRPSALSESLTLPLRWLEGGIGVADSADRELVGRAREGGRRKVVCELPGSAGVPESTDKELVEPSLDDGMLLVVSIEQNFGSDDAIGDVRGLPEDESLPLRSGNTVRFLFLE